MYDCIMCVLVIYFSRFTLTPPPNHTLILFSHHSYGNPLSDNPGHKDTVLHKSTVALLSSNYCKLHPSHAFNSVCEESWLISVTFAFSATLALWASSQHGRTVFPSPSSPVAFDWTLLNYKLLCDFRSYKNKRHHMLLPSLSVMDRVNYPHCERRRAPSLSLSPSLSLDSAQAEF